MDRRRFLGTLTGGLLAAPLGVEAQQTGLPAHTVGVLSPHDQYRDKEYPAFIATLHSLGYEERRPSARSVDGHDDLGLSVDELLQRADQVIE